MIRRLLALPLVALITASACQCASAKDIEQLEFKDLIAAKQRPQLMAPAASMPNPDKLVVPPQEVIYFPVRADGQSYTTTQDTTVNLTRALNEFYFDPKWRGETWGPFNTYWIVERMAPQMPTWQDYDQFTIFRVGNRWHKFWEKYSGYGP